MEPTEQVPTPLNPLIEDVAFILNSQANEIGNFVGAMYQTQEQYGNPVPGEPISKENILIEGASRYALIMVCSFEDEFTDRVDFLIGRNVERDRLLKLKRIARPALNGIRHFTGLRDYRSKLLAHNMRVQREDNRNAFRGSFISDLKVPITLPDYKFIAQCVHLCRRVFNKIFPEYERLPTDFIQEHTNGNLPVGYTTAEADARINEIVEQLRTLEGNE